MTIIPYNFNGSNSTSYYLAMGWQSFNGSLVTSDDDFYKYRLQTYYTGATRTPPLSAAVSSISVKELVKWEGSDQQPFLIIEDASYNQHAYLIRTSGGALALYINKTLVATSDVNLLKNDVEYNIEIYLKLGSSSGVVHLYINGSEVFPAGASSSQTYFYSGNTEASTDGAIYVSNINSTTLTYHIYDIIIDDDPTEGTPIGNRYAKTLWPASVSSQSSTVTTSDSSDANTVLSTVTPDGDPYVDFGTVDDALTVSFDSLDSDITDVSGVSVRGHLQKSGTGDGSVQISMNVGSTTTESDEIALSTSYEGVVVNSDADTDLTVSNVNSMTATITRTA